MTLMKVHHSMESSINSHIASIKTNRDVKFFKYAIETDEIAHTIKTTSIELKTASVKRTESWKISGDPTLRNLTDKQDIFTLKRKRSSCLTKLIGRFFGS